MTIIFFNGHIFFNKSTVVIIPRRSPFTAIGNLPLVKVIEGLDINRLTVFSFLLIQNFRIFNSVQLIPIPEFIIKKGVLKGEFEFVHLNEGLIGRIKISNRGAVVKIVGAIVHVSTSPPLPPVLLFPLSCRRGGQGVRQERPNSERGGEAKYVHFKNPGVHDKIPRVRASVS